MTESSRERLRRTFTEVAELYDQARPGYPAELFDDLTELAGLEPGSRVLELGCGTGQATVPLARRGYRVVAVELGPQLAEVARRNLARFAAVEVVNAAFEEWVLPDEPFDAVVSATAFTWIDPELRVGKSADALRPGGTLATVATHHVAGGSAAFFAEVQECYERFDPLVTPGQRLPTAADVPYDSADVDASPRFGPARFRRYETDRPYTTESYLDVQRTYSPNLDMGPEVREPMLASIGELIDRRYGGRIVKRYLRELRVAQRIG